MYICIQKRLAKLILYIQVYVALHKHHYVEVQIIMHVGLNVEYES